MSLRVNKEKCNIFNVKTNTNDHRLAFLKKKGKKKNTTFRNSKINPQISACIHTAKMFCSACIEGTFSR